MSSCKPRRPIILHHPLTASGRFLGLLSVVQMKPVELPGDGAQHSTGWRRQVCLGGRVVGWFGGLVVWFWKAYLTRHRKDQITTRLWIWRVGGLVTEWGKAAFATITEYFCFTMDTDSWWWAAKLWHTLMVGILNWTLLYLYLYKLCYVMNMTIVCGCTWYTLRYIQYNICILYKYNLYYTLWWK